jgi:hypothetical protein
MASGEKAQSLEMTEKPSAVLSNEPELAEALRNYVPQSAEEKKLVRKIDLFLMPMLWIMYILNYVDRTNIVGFSPTPTPTPMPQLPPADPYYRAMPKSQAWQQISSSMMTATPGSCPSSFSATSFARCLPT